MSYIAFVWIATLIFAVMTVAWGKDTLVDLFIKAISFVITMYGAALIWEHQYLLTI